MPATLENAERAHGFPPCARSGEARTAGIRYIMPNFCGSQVDMVGT